MTTGNETENATPAVTENVDRHRYEIAVSGALAGHTDYVDDDDASRIFFHTEVDEAYAGQGLAGILVRHALDATRATGRQIVPVCPYVARYVKGHHDWDDLLRPVTPAALRLAQRAMGA